jgi:hypothetical protein
MWVHFLPLLVVNLVVLRLLVLQLLLLLLLLLLLQVLWQRQQLVPQHTICQEAPALQHRHEAMLLQHSLKAVTPNALRRICCCCCCCCCCWGDVVQGFTCRVLMPAIAWVPTTQQPRIIHVTDTCLLLLLRSVVTMVVVVVVLMGLVGCCKSLHALCHLCNSMPGCISDGLGLRCCEEEQQQIQRRQT